MENNQTPSPAPVPEVSPVAVPAPAESTAAPSPALPVIPLRELPNAPLLHKGFQNLFRLSIANGAINLLNNTFKLGDKIPSLGVVLSVVSLAVSILTLIVIRRERGKNKQQSQQNHQKDEQAGGIGFVDPLLQAGKTDKRGKGKQKQRKKVEVHDIAEAGDGRAQLPEHNEPRSCPHHRSRPRRKRCHSPARAAGHPPAREAKRAAWYAASVANRKSNPSRMIRTTRIAETSDAVIHSCTLGASRSATNGSAITRWRQNGVHSAPGRS